MKKPIASVDSKQKQTDDAGEPYKVGPGHPPLEYQFKPGSSGNPSGRKGKKNGVNVPEILTRNLTRKVSVTRDGKREITTPIEIGCEQLTNQFAKGDRHARRELMDLAQRLGLPIFGQVSDRITQLMQPSDQHILDQYVAKRSEGKNQSSETPILAPPELRDDDTI